jgi:ribosomal protein S18 acetylase RimI-like enzyme
MPDYAPTRAHLRAVAFQHNHPPELELGRLLQVIVHEQRAPKPVQYLCYGAEYWLTKALGEAGFSQVEAVQFYQLDRLRARIGALPLPPPALMFTPVLPAQLDELAILDAETFDPLWHFGRRDLFELLMRGRIQAAWWEGEMVGYSAVCANNQREAQLARLAVHPHFQGRGIGRALLCDAIRHAAAEFSVLVLNTQINNSRSQTLYRSLGFRPIGTALAVLGLTVPA